MTEEELNKQKLQLIEQLGVLMEKKHQLAPLAARIISTLVLNGKQGVTFDQFVNDLQASKSSISTHLDHLQSSRKIQYFTKPGDRKRYFVINPNLTVEVIDETVAAWESEENVQKEILKYKEQSNEFNSGKDLPEFDLEFQQSYLTFLQESKAAIEKLKHKIINRNG